MSVGRAEETEREEREKEGEEGSGFSQEPHRK
jgi:hypothetical protein